MAGGLHLGRLAAAQTQESTRPRSSDLPAKFTPSAFAVPSTKYSPFTTPDYYTYADDLVIERNRPGKPHAGKVLAAVQAHSDDIPLFAAGTVAKLIDEGYTGYLIRFSNDEAAGRTLGYGVVQNEPTIRMPRRRWGARRLSRSTTAITAWTTARWSRSACSPDLSLPAAAGEYGRLHGSVQPLRREPGPHRRRQSGGGRVLDVGQRAGTTPSTTRPGSSRRGFGRNTIMPAPRKVTTW